MSNMNRQETGDVLGDDRDYFEEDFAPLVPGSFVELPEGWESWMTDSQADTGHLFPAFLTRDLGDGSITSVQVGRMAGSDRQVKWSVRLDEDELGKPAFRDIQIEGVDGEFDFVGYVSRRQLDDEQTKETIADLQRNGVVTIVDGKTGLSMDADAYENAALSLLGGAALPYEDPSEASPATDWAHAAVRGVIDELRDRGGIGHALQDVDPVVRKEIVESLSDIVRAAFIGRAA
ncbi:hypothetical protein [Rhizobium pisi]|uniref:hypothetical protein n=1 Tax=Rhizobium pisi TaxID=574561 RepID=UPI003CFC8F6A